jgi:type I site-specific restriction endonuclease
MNEAETRAEHIDPALKAAGWGVVDVLCTMDATTAHPAMTFCTKLE